MNGKKVMESHIEGTCWQSGVKGSLLGGEGDS